MRRLSGQDAAFLYGETPNWHMHISGLMVLDPSDSPEPFSFDRYREILIERLPEVPQLRWKLVDVPFGIDRPRWIEDPDLDPDYHIRRIGLPTPGGERELHEVVGRIAGYKLNRAKPLWEAWVIEGLEGGKVATLMKMHHALVDGVSGAGLSEVMLDLEPTPRPPSGETVERIETDRIPSDLELFAVGALTSLVDGPRRTRKFLTQTLRQVRAVRPQFDQERQPTLPIRAPRTVLNQDPSPRRRFAASSIDLDRARRVKDAFGVKLNDVVLALCASTLRDYLADHGGVPEDPLVTQCPVSLRPQGDADVGNKVGSMFASLATDIDDPVERLATIHESTTSAKAMREAMSAHQIMGITEIMAPAWIGLAARMYTRRGLAKIAPPSVNVAISNVPGPDFPLYMVGSRVQTMYPMGPLILGMSLNITVFSYDGRLDFGFMVCPEAIPDPEALADGIERAIAELEAAMPGATKGRAKKSGTKKSGTKKSGASTRTRAPKKKQPAKA